MALPPQSFGNMMDPAMDPAAVDPRLAVDIPMSGPMDFAGGAEVIEGPEGALVQALGMQDEMMEEILQVPFDANLAEYIDDGELGALANDLVGAYEDDLSSRSEWEEKYVKGLDLLGVKPDEERSTPFDGASAVTHPLIAESIIQFQAQAYKEILPAGGPVRTKINGAETPEKQEQAARVKNYMNHLIMDEMEEYDPDTDQLLFYLPLSGSAFKKVYYDPELQRPVSQFVPAQDVVIPYSASDLRTAPRITHVLKMQDNDVRKLQVAGVYRDIDLSPAGHDAPDKVRQKVDELEGIKSSYTDDVRTILEIHVLLDLEDFPDINPATGEPTGIKLPYIVAIDKDSSEVLSIRRNYREEDPRRVAMDYFVHYKFLPGLGFYGFGLTHMIGGLGRAATSLMRQLIDAGTLANLPAGFKARGVRVTNHDEPLQPGEWRDIDTPGGNLRDALLPLPYKEPSATLAQLLGVLVEEGRRFVSIADEQMQGMNQEMPVGTAVAMLERGTKVLSAIHKRLHYAQKREFRILARVIGEHLPLQYPYELPGETGNLKQQDFNGSVDILPVSDPNIFSMAQRVALAQEQLRLAQSNPQMHNLHAAYRRMYQALEIQNVDEILPPPEQPQPMDPAMENGRALVGTPLQAFDDQNHDAHIKAHIAVLNVPIYAATPHAITALHAHLQEHIALLARQQAQQQYAEMREQAMISMQAGAMDPVDGQQQIQQIDAAMSDPQHFADYVALLQQQILEKLMPELMPPQADPSADPLVQIRQAEVALRAQKQQQDAVKDERRDGIEHQRLEQRATTDLARMDMQQDIADERARVNRERIAASLRMAQMRMQGR
jgi:hypothetical protein